MAKRTLKQHHKDRLLAILAVVLLLLLLLWWAAAHYHWGPYRIKATTPTTSSVAPTTSSSSSTSSGASGTSGTNGAAGTNGTNGTTTTTTPPGANTPIFNLYGSVHNGETQGDVSASAGGLNPDCVTLSSTPGSKQEVCTYQDGSRVVTITYLNDNVVSISKSGF